MSETRGYLVLESGEIFAGLWPTRETSKRFERAGEVVFNTSHGGYEEIATDPSCFGQIIVFTAPQQGNYGADNGRWESRRIWIEGCVCVEMQTSARENTWADQLAAAMA